MAKAIFLEWTECSPVKLANYKKIDFLKFQFIFILGRLQALLSNNNRHLELERFSNLNDENLE